MHNQPVIPGASVVSLAHLLALVVSSPKHMTAVMEVLDRNSNVRTLVQIELEESLVPTRSPGNAAPGGLPRITWPLTRP